MNMKKFNIQDRIILDDALDSFLVEAKKVEENAELINERPIITYNYWKQMMTEVQSKIDSMTTKKALYHSQKYR